MRTPLAIVIASLSLAACANGGVQSMPQNLPQNLPLSPAAARGQQFAERACAGCHAFAAPARSANTAAPPFAVVRLRHNEVALERTLETIAREGHGEMPPIYITSAEIEDLVAFIESLEPVAGLDPGAPASGVRLSGGSGEAADAARS